MTDLLDRLTALILAGDLTEQHLISLVNYLLLAGEASDAKVFVQQLAQRVPQHEEKLMTIAQQLKQTGVQEGMKMGVEKGMRKGMRLGRKAEARNIARAMLRQGFDLQSVATLTGLSKVELRNDMPGGSVTDDLSTDQLRALTDRYHIDIITINALYPFNHIDDALLARAGKTQPHPAFCALPHTLHFLRNSL